MKNRTSPDSRFIYRIQKLRAISLMANLPEGKNYPFSNIITALKEFFRETHRPYPRGAGARYLGAFTSGELAACHRFVENENGYFEILQTVIDQSR